MIKDDLRPDQSTLDNKEMAISKFGIACLKGMGWKKDGIRLTNKRCVSSVKLIERPARQGLGAGMVSQPILK